MTLQFDPNRSETDINPVQLAGDARDDQPSPEEPIGATFMKRHCGFNELSEASPTPEIGTPATADGHGPDRGQGALYTPH